MSIYGKYGETIENIRGELESRLQKFNRDRVEATGDTYYEHLASRIKTEASMREKCGRKGLPESEKSALVDIKDAIGLRIVCNFLDDIYACRDFLEGMPDCTIVEEKDYIKNSKPNGYRSYHMILEIEVPEEDVLGNTPGHFYAEVQLRTIAMDTWASLEHEMKYKRTVGNPAMITAELKRCADELASCDIQLMTLRDLIRSDS